MSIPLTAEEVIRAYEICAKIEALKAIASLAEGTLQKRKRTKKPRPQLLSLAEVAQVLKCSKSKVSQLRRSGVLPADKNIGNSPRWLWSTIEGYLQS